jgi:5-methylcytosine-specific restriction endonuclease McrA
MVGKEAKERAWLVEVARVVAQELKRRKEGTALNLRLPGGSGRTNTDGWEARIGYLGNKKLRLSVWLDRFSGYPDRKFYACFWSPQRAPLVSIKKRLDATLWPVREISMNDTTREDFLFLTDRLKRSEFNKPILEKYEGGRTFFGIYDPTRETSDRINPYFVDRAVAFFLDVAESLPDTKPNNGETETYPQIERTLVKTHLQRERSRLLAHDCKERDQYECQVCGMRFEDFYGKLGKDFAEAHHLVPLGKLKGEVRTELEDLITVCANCHRMLHKMDGKADDYKKLRATVRRLQR